MKYVQIARDYYWFYGIICVNLLSPLAIAEWIEMARTADSRRGGCVSASDSGVD